MAALEVTSSNGDGDGDGVATVAVDGDLDIATAPVLEAALKRIERGRPATLLLDLSGVVFMDSTGLRSLLSARRRAQDGGHSLRLANLQPDVARVFDVTGVRRVFDIAPS